MNGLLEVHFVDCAALQNLFHRCENETYWQCRAVGNVSGKSNCRSRGLEFDPSLVHTFAEIDHEIISKVILLPSAESFKKGCCQLQAKVCAGKVSLGELTVPP